MIFGLIMPGSERLPTYPTVQISGVNSFLTASISRNER